MLHFLNKRLNRRSIEMTKVAFCIAACVIFALPAWPQQQTPDLADRSLEDLMNIEVTSVSKKEQKLSQTPAAVFVITEEDIRRSGATNIPDLLRMVPGLDVAQINANTWAISARGFNLQFANKLLVLIDGRAVYTPLFGGVYWDTQDVPLEDIERIEVIRGPGGTIWGANAVNGVINIITKSAANTTGTLATLGSGTVDQGTGGLRYGGSAGGDFNYRIYGMGSIRGPEYHPDGDGFDRWRMGQMGFRADWQTSGQSSLTVQGDAYRVASGERTFIASFSPPAETQPDG